MRPTAPEAARTTALAFVWFAFLNAQLLLAMVCLLRWRILNPGVPLARARWWDSALLARPAGLCLVLVASFLLTAGFMLPGILAQRRKPPGEAVSGDVRIAPLLAAYAVHAAVSLLGAVFGFFANDPLLAVPFIAASVIALVALYPSTRRLSRVFPTR